MFVFLRFIPFLGAFYCPLYREGLSALAVALLSALHIWSGLWVAAGGDGAVATIFCLAAYAAVLLGCIKASPGKLLFTLLLVVNYAHFVVASGKSLEFLLFPTAARVPYRATDSLSVVLILLPTFPLIFRFMREKLSPMLQSPRWPQLWRILWLVPLTFYLSCFYSFYLSGHYKNTAQWVADLWNLVFIAAITLGSILIYLVVIRMLEESEKALCLLVENQMLALQSKQYHVLREHIEEARRAGHDLRQHVRALEGMLEAREYDAASDYLHHISGSLPSNVAPLCANRSLDALSRHYLAQAEKLHIRMEISLSLPDSLPLPDTDLCILVGNLLENAIEACQRQLSGDRFIRCGVRLAGSNLLSVNIDNSFGERPKQNSGGFLSSKRDGEGAGIRSVRSITQKHHGNVDFQMENGVFSVTAILLPR